MVTAIDDLIKRLDIADSSFTRDEVTSLIDWYVAQATNNDICAMRKAVEQDALNAIVAANNKTLQTLLANWDTTPTTPTLQVISYE